MIVDHIRNRANYYCLGEGFKKALDYCAAYQKGRTEKADEPIDGDNVFVRIRPMISKPIDECKIEAHDLYADIHYVAAGSEVIGWADTKTLKVVSYDEAKDAYHLEGDCSYVTLEEGYFMLTLKDDAQMPCIAKDGVPGKLEKLCLKIKL